MIRWLDKRVRRIAAAEVAKYAQAQEAQRSVADALSEAGLAVLKSNIRIQSEKLFGDDLPPEMVEYLDAMLGML